MIEFGYFLLLLRSHKIPSSAFKNGSFPAFILSVTQLLYTLYARFKSYFSSRSKVFKTNHSIIKKFN